MAKLKRGLIFWLLLLFGWWWLTEGDHQAWWFGIPVTLLIALLMLRLWPDLRLRWSVLPGFVGFFLLQSWRGGWDVAARALAPKIQIEPCFIDYKLRLAPGLARDIWLSSIGLFPGTMAVAIEQNQVKVHVLDSNMSVLAGLVTLEDYLIRLIPDSQRNENG